MTCMASMSPMPESGSRFYGQAAPFPLPHLSQSCRGSCRAASVAHSPSPAGKYPETSAILRCFLPHPLLGHAFPVGPALTGFPFAGASFLGHRLLDLGRAPFPARCPGPASGCAAYRQLLLLRDLLQSGSGGRAGLRHVFWRKGHCHRGVVPDLRRNVLLRDLLSCGTPSWRRRGSVLPALLPARSRAAAHPDRSGTGTCLQHAGRAPSRAAGLCGRGRHAPCHGAFSLCHRARAASFPRILLRA